MSISTATHYDAEQLYNLIPTVYRLRDHERWEAFKEQVKNHANSGSTIDLLLNDLAENGSDFKGLLELLSNEGLTLLDLSILLEQQKPPLRAFVEVLAEQAVVLERDLEQLYDNWFIETCAPWLVPYIGDLVGNRPIYPVAQTARADVAKTIYYRRRKGTLAMLEELVRDVSGWDTHAVEFFQNLGWTQNMNHRRFEMSPNASAQNPNAVSRVGTVNLRDMDAVDRLDGAFDILSHTVDVRLIGHGERPRGLHNLKNIGFYLHRLSAYPLSNINPRRSNTASHGFHFSPLGNPAPLFTESAAETDATGLAKEIHIDAPIRASAFYYDLAHYKTLPSEAQTGNSDYYGAERSLHIQKNGVSVPPENIVCMNLENWAEPPAGKVGVDVERGRLTVPASEAGEALEVAFAYGFSGDIGGGSYDRRASLVQEDEVELAIAVEKDTATDTLQKALQQWQNAGHPSCLIELQDNGIYGGNLDISLPANSRLVIQAKNERWPSVRPVGTASNISAGEGARLVLSGLLVEGGFELNGALDFRLLHCTLVPGRRLKEDGSPRFPDRDSLVVNTASSELQVTLEKCITGALRLPKTSRRLTIEDSLIRALPVGGSLRPAIAANDAGSESAVTRLERVTLWGEVCARELEFVSDVIFNHPVKTLRRQTGCVRFSHLPEGSVTPKRYRCQPDLALLSKAKERGLAGVSDLPVSDQHLIKARLKPVYSSSDYGDPGFGQLRLSIAEEIFTGAENGAEMGAFNLLLQAQREANIRQRLNEYLPFGLEAGLIYVT